MEINLKKKKRTLANNNKLFNGRNHAINSVYDYSSMILETWREPEPEPTKAKTKCKKYPLELREGFIDEI